MLCIPTECNFLASRSRAFRPRRVWKTYVVLVIFICSCFYFIVDYFVSAPTDLPKKYFIESYNPDELQYVVNTSACKIVNVGLWADWALPYLKPLQIPPDCKANRAWTYTNGSILTVNETALEQSGFSLKTVHCCYKVIKRVEQSWEAYDEYADRDTSISKDCIALKRAKTSVSEEFLKVQCISKVWPMEGDVLYRQYHALAQPLKNKATKSKRNKWKDSKDLPPNVFILGIDSMSNANFGRTMPKTKQYLKDIGAVEMLGYTKVGYNTFPNMVAALTGYSEQDLKHVCFYNATTPLDACPFIWKRFDAAGYLTGHLEDGPLLNMLNYGKFGVVKQQVDFYLRPFMFTVYGKEIAGRYHMDCIGSKTVDETVLDYAEELFEASSGVPQFLFTWMTDLAHGDMNKPKFSDGIYERFLKRLNLSNTVLFFIGDHGVHSGEFQSTFNGWFEERTPNFWIYLPPKIRETYLDWMRNVYINARRLSSAFDLYHTMNHLLREFSHLPHPENEMSQKNATMRRRHGQSFFKEIPGHRTCAGAGIGDDYCVCSVPVKIDLERTDVKLAAEAAIRHINKMIPAQCAAFHLRKLYAAASREEAVLTDFVDRALYTIIFFVDPGNFLFEATMEYHSIQGEFLVKGNIMRVSKMNTDLSCIKDYVLEKFCYCN